MMTLFFAMIICTFIWTGFVCSISFMESWLKFRAPNVTMPVGLSIGKLIFKALNMVEWALAVFIVIGIFLNRNEITSLTIVWYVIIIVILIVQTAWLLPALDARANAFISGTIQPPSILHWYFVAAEFIKIILLFLFGIGLLKSISQLILV